MNYFSEIPKRRSYPGRVCYVCDAGYAPLESVAKVPVCIPCAKLHGFYVDRLTVEIAEKLEITPRVDFSAQSEPGDNGDGTYSVDFGTWPSRPYHGSTGYYP